MGRKSIERDNIYHYTTVGAALEYPRILSHERIKVSGRIMGSSAKEPEWAQADLQEFSTLRGLGLEIVNRPIKANITIDDELNAEKADGPLVDSSFLQPMASVALDTSHEDNEEPETQIFDALVKQVDVEMQQLMGHS
ncbi:hypothetical protein FQN53_002484 [Emmonsiellopsis sp. PD_33]|nr:hypothetical protein FQN53_002484 [Emmonsiellopsis sp. PD_33]KAK2798257.1 hypothetical protein FQN51_007823 [Onygenales sp. PD_10]